ncbi:hypothetical protein GQ53DRAFT_752402 [Thozetella sp. PMI_491]|nr:hypothetical protein GQ53DRAFT_752402 [Thozetella sp. PMI_491]
MTRKYLLEYEKVASRTPFVVLSQHTAIDRFAHLFLDYPKVSFEHLLLLGAAAPIAFYAVIGSCRSKRKKSYDVPMQQQTTLAMIR